ncbi:hypothetical protein ColKHC_06985 [Colletotrichum higginsianum]|nr:hypothetical protein ColKHC_06985 [Colletotrichum higginsianum]
MKTPTPEGEGNSQLVLELLYQACAMPTPAPVPMRVLVLVLRQGGQADVVQGSGVILLWLERYPYTRNAQMQQCTHNYVAKALEARPWLGLASDQ